MSLLRWSVLVPIAALALPSACGDTIEGATSATSGSTTPDAGPPIDAGPDPLACAPGSLAQPDGTCLEAGVPDLPCPPGELLAGGLCAAAGIPPDACGRGFASDGDGGCTPILPADPCAPGTFALPGETACHPAAACGAGTWGDIPLDPMTQHVDASYPGADSDGTSGKPWLTIQAGVDAAVPGAIVAIAAGTYAETVIVMGKPVRLWGKCPGDVTITGPMGVSAVIDIGVGATATEVRGLAVTGSGIGVSVNGAADVAVEGVWIHDTSDLGVAAQDYQGVTGVEIRSTLVEAAGGIGVYSWGSDVLLDGVVVRGTLPSSNLEFGRGVTGFAGVESGTRASLTLRSSIVEQCREYAVLGVGADVVVEDSLVRETLPRALDQILGRAIDVQRSTGAAVRSSLAVWRSVVQGALQCGICATDAEVDIEHTVVRDVLSQESDGVGGIGIAVVETFGPPDAPAQGTLRASLVERVAMFGVAISGCEGAVESVWVRDVEPQAADGQYGRGMSVEIYPVTGIPGSATIRGSVFERTHEIGLSVLGASAEVESIIVRDVQPRASDGLLGRGISAEIETQTRALSSLVVTGSLVERTHSLGILSIASDMVVDSTVVRDVEAQEADGFGGMGISATFDPVAFVPAGPLTVTRCLVERVRTFGIVVGGSEAWIESTIVRDVLTQPLDGDWGVGIVAFSGTNFGGGPSDATVRGCVIERTSTYGLGVGGSKALVEQTAIRDVAPRADGLFGRGLGIEPDEMTKEPSSATVRATSVERTHEFGLVVLGSDAVIESTTIRDTRARDDGQYGRGLGVQFSFEAGTRATATLRGVRIENSFETGLFIAGADVDAEDLLVGGTVPQQAGGLFGDGILVAAIGFVDGTLGPSSLALRDSQVQTSARAGVSCFAATVAIEGTTFECNGIDLDGEVLAGSPFDFEDLGGNTCGCSPQAETCTVLSSGLTAPDPIQE